MKPVKLDPKQILFNDEHLLVLNKAAGQLSQLDKSGDPDVTRLLQKYFYQTEGAELPFLAPVHRLDRNTSGLLVLAKTSAAAKYFSEALQAGEMKRTYLAIVKGDPGAKGTIDAPLAKDEESNETFVKESGKKAITHYKRLEKFPATALMEVTIETGRSHQIRAHMAHIKCSLIGDRKYAKKPWSEIFARPALHAAGLRFIHPETKKEMNFRIPIPMDMEKLRIALRG